MQKKWIVKEVFSQDKDIISQLLTSRGIEDVSTFLNPPTINSFFEKFPEDLRTSLSQAKKIINEHLSQNLPIVIYGDYDVDGICATTIIYSTLKDELNCKKISYFIPNRFEHGYGVSKIALDLILSESQTKYPDEKVLFITVDTGITAVEEVKYLKELGHRIIVTDHHQKPDIVPEADVTVWYDQVVGAMVSWILSRVLGSKNKQSLAYAGLATVTDLQALLDLNRTVVKRGLEIINTNPPLGLKTLLQVASKSSGDVKSYDLGWLLGPRLNASGRLGNATDSVKLLLADSISEAENLAVNINNINTQRQDMTVEMYDVAGSNEHVLSNKIIISYDEKYHEGIIGLVAARLSQKYYRPAIVISVEDEFGKGSVRSIPGVNIIEMLRLFSDLFSNLGGHPMAAGFSIPKENIPELEKRLTEYANEHISEDLLVPSLDVDMEIPISEINLELVESIESFQPFGLGNPEPVFVSRSVGVSDINHTGRESQHLSLKFYDKGNYYKGVMFNSEDMGKDLAFGDKVDIVYTLKKNVFNGKTYIDLFLKDFIKIS